jgi:hypothetical protein
LETRNQYAVGSKQKAGYRGQDTEDRGGRRFGWLNWFDWFDEAQGIRAKEPESRSQKSGVRIQETD